MVATHTHTDTPGTFIDWLRKGALVSLFKTIFSQGSDVEPSGSDAGSYYLNDWPLMATFVPLECLCVDGPHIDHHHP